MVRVLVVEDEANIRDMIALNLRHAGMEVVEAESAEAALPLLAQKPGCDAAILDVMLPGLDGWGVCRAIRAESQTPIIMLTAKSETEDKVNGLKQGADDYITKPFNPLELVARVKTQLRRYTTYNVAAESRKQIHDFAGLYICRDNRKCSLYGRELALTPLEFDILWYLCEHKGTVVSSEVLFEAVWGEKYLDNNNTVMAHIARLREKMGEPSRKPRFIKTVWGVGYTIE